MFIIYATILTKVIYHNVHKTCRDPNTLTYLYSSLHIKETEQTIEILFEQQKKVTCCFEILCILSWFNALFYIFVLSVVMMYLVLNAIAWEFFLPLFYQRWLSLFLDIVKSICDLRSISYEKWHYEVVLDLILYKLEAYRERIIITDSICNRLAIS